MRRLLLFLALLLCSSCTRLFMGYASTPDRDSQGRVILEHVLRANVDDLKEYSTVLLNHDHTKPIGRVRRAWLGEEGLLVVVEVTDRETWRLIRLGTLSKLSPMWRPDDVRHASAPGEGVVMVMWGGKMLEVSVVSVPANPRARILFWWREW